MTTTDHDLTASQRVRASAGTGVVGRLASLFDRVDALSEALRNAAVTCALVGLAVHLGLVLLANVLSDPPALVAAVGHDYLAALYTPFSFVLVYEVLLLILAIPESMTRSLGRQFEILSLIVIRNAFKDVAEFESIGTLDAASGPFTSVLLDMGGGVVMFALVAGFYFVNSKRPRELAEQPPAQRIRLFVARKKVIALALFCGLFVIAAVNLVSWIIESVQVARGSAVPSIDVKRLFYVELFTAMIFANAVILLLAMRVQDTYAVVFRNAAFVVCTVLVLFSLAADKPYDVALGAGSIAFGAVVVAIYNASLRIGVDRERERSNEPEPEPEDAAEAPVV